MPVKPLWLWLALASVLPAAPRVIIVGLDGASPNGLRNAKTPNIGALRDAGAYTYHARGVMPTVSSPNWASMIMGAGPEQHGITSNEWEREKFEIPPTATGPGGIFPTIFGVLREQKPAARIGCFYDWKGFGRLLEPKAPDALEHGEGPADTVRRAVAFWKSRKPDFIFIQLDHVDHAGHESGHGTPPYYEAIAEADRLIGEMIAAVRQTGLNDETVFIVTADHGGRGKKHGEDNLDCIEIPWIIAGPGIARGRQIKAPVNIFDTAPTVARLLGLKAPECWIGRPVEEALQSAVK
jgi:predicted AlkP superfamily pyrophosphatase or phosphodiesterase